MKLQIKCNELLLEDTDIPKALTECISTHSIELLVLGACSKGGIVRYVNISFVTKYKQKLVQESWRIWFKFPLARFFLYFVNIRIYFVTKYFWLIWFCLFKWCIYNLMVWYDEQFMTEGSEQQMFQPQFQKEHHHFALYILYLKAKYQVLNLQQLQLQNQRS